VTNLSWQLGVNMREFAYYGTQILPQIPPTHQRDQLNKLKEIGVKLVRFYATQKSFSEPDIRNLVGQALDLLNEFGMHAIVCLTDALTENGYFVPADEPFYQEINHLHKRYWHEKGFLQNNGGHPCYMDFVTQMVTTFKNHPAVMIWELGNEYVILPRPALHDDSEAFLKFVKSASQKIKGIAPNHLVSIGLLNTGQISPDGEDRAAFAARLYGISSVDLVSLHFYREDGEETNGLVDTKLHKPFYVGELGADISQNDHFPIDRPTYFKNKIEEWRTNKAFSVMPWAFNVSPSDWGISDTRAVAAKHPDFGAIVDVLKAQAQSHDIQGVIQGMAEPEDAFSVAAAPDQAEDSIILPVPWYSQVDGLFSKKLYEACGPTSVLMILSAYKAVQVTDASQMTQYNVAPHTPVDLSQTTGSTELKYLAQDAGQLTLVDAGVSVNKLADTLRAFLEESKPIMMLLNYWKINSQPFKGNKHWKPGRNKEIHWWVVVGTDGDQFIVNDPLWQQWENQKQGGNNLRISEADLCAAYYDETLLVPDKGITGL
jgi:uncharacterized protein YvpB